MKKMEQMVMEDINVRTRPGERRQKNKYQKLLTPLMTSKCKALKNFCIVEITSGTTT